MDNTHTHKRKEPDATNQSENAPKASVPVPDSKRIASLAARFDMGMGAPPNGESAGVGDVQAHFPPSAAQKEKKTSEVERVPTISAALESQSDEESFTCSSNDAIELKLVRSVSDLDNPDTAFKPALTHQMFENESIYGYKDLKIKWYYSASGLVTYLDLAWSKIVPRSSSAIFTIGKAPERMPDPIIDGIETWLPTGYHKSLDTFKESLESADEKQFNPAILDVKSVHSFTSNDREFEVFLGDFTSEKLREYHRHLRTLSILFVDAAEYIDDTDPKWRIFLVFEKVKNEDDNAVQWFIAGYTTVYTFFGYPDSEKHRICQMLVLPPFQGMGLGRALYSAIYQVAKDSKAIEVNVEDPSDGMATLRLVVDMLLLFKAGDMQPGQAVIERPMIDTLHTKHRLNRRQLVKCAECFALMDVDQSDENALKTYRLRVKKRLFRQEEEVLLGIEDVIERKKVLQLLYEEDLALYSRAMTAFGKLKLK